MLGFSTLLLAIFVLLFGIVTINGFLETVMAQTKAVVIIDLNGARIYALDYGSDIVQGTIYNPIAISSNHTGLQGLELGGILFVHYVSVSNDSIGGTIPVKIANSSDQKQNEVKDVKIDLNVDSIITKPDGLLIYHGKSGSSNSKIGNTEIIEGTLVQNTNSEARLVLNVR